MDRASKTLETSSIAARIPFFPIERADLLVKLHSIRAWATPVLLYLPREIRNRTYHGPEHSLRVLVYLDDLLKVAGLGFEPNEIEFFVLEASTWLHDVGYMLPKPNMHARHSGDLIKRYGRKYMHLDKAEMTAVAWICGAHSKFSLRSVPDILILHKMEVRSQYLAALFSLADACDVETRRAPEEVFEIIRHELNRRARKSIPHWRANQSVDGVYFSVPDRTIYICPLNVRLACQAKMRLQKEVDRALPILGDSFPLREVDIYRMPEFRRVAAPSSTD